MSFCLAFKVFSFLVLLVFLSLRKDTLTKATLTKESIQLGLTYRFRGSAHCRHGNHGGMQPDIVLDEELRVPHGIDRQQEDTETH